MLPLIEFGKQQGPASRVAVCGADVTGGNQKPSLGREEVLKLLALLVFERNPHPSFLCLHKFLDLPIGRKSCL